MYAYIKRITISNEKIDDDKDSYIVELIDPSFKNVDSIKCKSGFT